MLSNRLHTYLCALGASVLLVGILSGGLVQATQLPKSISPGDGDMGAPRTGDLIAGEIFTASTYSAPVGYGIDASAKGNYRTRNAQNGLSITYGEKGTTTLRPILAPHRWSISVRLTGVGYETISHVEAPTRLSSESGRLSYHWGEDLIEWWVNEPAGLEQWFRLKDQPEGQDQDSPLRVRLAFDTDLPMNRTAEGIGFGRNNTRITYSDLEVWDATGSRLPARMTLEDDSLVLAIDDHQATYPVTIDPTFRQETYLKASNADGGVADDPNQPGDQFGAPVAVGKDTVVVGARLEGSASTGVNGDQNDESAPFAGAAYIFERDPFGIWVQTAYLKASNAEPDAADFFGASVAVSGDTVVVGAPQEDSGASGVNGDQSDNSEPASGAAYVFVRDDSGQWSQQAYIKASNPGTSDFFGSSVAISGNTLLVGAFGEESAASGVNGDQADNSLPGAGAAYVYTRDEAGSWSQEAYIKSPDPDGLTAEGGGPDLFARDVGLSGDTAVVGATGEDSGARGINGSPSDNSSTNSGAAYVYGRDSAGSWSLQAYLKAPNSDARDQFGFDVAISGDRVAVGAGNEDSAATDVNGDQSDNSATNAGAAYVYVRDDSGTWSHEAYIKASNADGSIGGTPGTPGFDDNGDLFGNRVALAGNRLVVGAAGEDSMALGVDSDPNDNSAEDTGAAYVFTRDDEGGWSQEDYIKAVNGDGQVEDEEGFIEDRGDLFGEAVAISGSDVVVGARLEDSASTRIDGNGADNSADDAGAAYIFGPATTSLSLEATNLSDIVGGNRKLIRFVSSNTGSGEAVGIMLSAAVPSELEPVTFYRLGRGCAVQTDNDVGCRANRTPEWQCEIDGQQLRCPLQELPAGSQAGVVLEVVPRSPGEFNVEGEVSADNADAVTATTSVEN